MVFRSSHLEYGSTSIVVKRAKDMFSRGLGAADQFFPESKREVVGTRQKMCGGSQVAECISCASANNSLSLFLLEKSPYTARDETRAKTQQTVVTHINERNTILFGSFQQQKYTPHVVRVVFLRRSRVPCCLYSTVFLHAPNLWPIDTYTACGWFRRREKMFLTCCAMPSRYKLTDKRATNS